MKSSVIINISILLLALFAIPDDAVACRKKIVVSSSLNLVGQFNTNNATYIIRDEIDLKEITLTIPDNSNLQFEGGFVKNGIIQGNNTCIIAERCALFKSIIISGSWKNKVVYGEWLDFVEGKKVDNARNFQNLMTLCKGDEMTQLYTKRGVYYCSVTNGSSNIIVPSNVYWHNSSTICQLPTDSPKSSLVVLHKSNNVTIDGGEFVGDVKTHIGSKGEWGHGIKLAGASNVTLKNFIAREFWGDGIDLIEADYVGAINAGVGNCSRINIDNVKCLYNRRQGMSIEAAENVVVKNSEFAYTGKIAFTAPGTGVDIEPWCRNEHKIFSIYFTNCHFHDNAGGSDFCCISNSQYRGTNVKPSVTPRNAIRIKECKMGRLYVEWVNDVQFSNCDIINIVHYSKGSKVVFSNNRIKKRALFQTYEGAKFIKNE